MQGQGSFFEALSKAVFASSKFALPTETLNSISPFFTCAALPVGFPKDFCIPVLNLSAPAPAAIGFSRKTW